MKIRIEDNSVRYRLRRSEVEQLAATGSIWASASFPEGPFTYGLCAAPDISDLRASRKEGKIVLYIPQAWTLQWPESSKVGFESQIAFDGNTLHILIEKDFVCLDRNLAEQSDQYPNPKG